MRLASEQPGGLGANVAIAIDNRLHKEFGASGLTNQLSDDKNGEIFRAGIAIDPSIVESGRSAVQIPGFVSEGLITPEQGAKELGLYYDLVIAHEFGHALGLRHNFAAVGTDSEGKLQVDALMSYFQLLLPVSLFMEQISYRPHDLLSLKYLYAELLPNPAEVRATTLSALLQYPLSSDEGTVTYPFHPFDFNAQAIQLLQQANDPHVVAFRDADQNWRKDIVTLHTTASKAE